MTAPRFPSPAGSRDSLTTSRLSPKCGGALLPWGALPVYQAWQERKLMELLNTARLDHQDVEAALLSMVSELLTKPGVTITDMVEPIESALKASISARQIAYAISESMSEELETGYPLAAETIVLRMIAFGIYLAGAMAERELLERTLTTVRPADDVKGDSCTTSI